MNIMTNSKKQIKKKVELGWVGSHFIIYQFQISAYLLSGYAKGEQLCFEINNTSLIS